MEIVVMVEWLVFVVVVIGSDVWQWFLLMMFDGVMVEVVGSSGNDGGGGGSWLW